MATGAAAAIARARRDIQHHFFSRDAVRPDRAVDFEPDRMIEQRQFERMQERGIIHRTNDGRYWLDVVACDVDLQQRYRRVRLALIVVLILFAVWIAVTSGAVATFVARAH